MEQNKQVSLDEVLARFREEAQGNKAALGTRFEWLVRQILTRLPLYRDHFRRVWLWSDLGQGHDTGIDLVAEDCEGKLCGIQAKCYEDGHVVSKPDIDTFLAKLGDYIQINGRPRAFSSGLIFASTDAWGKHADESLANRPIPVQVMTLSRLRALEADWAALAGYVEAPAVAPKALRDYQVEALAAAAAHYATHDRGKLIMACGTGKTFTSLRLVEQETGGRGLVLFLVPSIALLNQTLVTWSDDAACALHAICVCSDVKANQRAKREEDVPDEDPNALALPPTTRPDTLADRIRHFRDAFPNDLTVVFSTYQSIETVMAAQERLGREEYAFDFAVCDEAHRTTGTIAKEEDEPAFTLIHNDANLLVRKRLYMTATPRLYSSESKARAKEQSIELCSMDDRALYGDEIYHIGFGTAVEKGFLADYKVLVLTLPECALLEDSPYERLTDNERKALESRNDDGRTTAVKLLGCINALGKRLVDSPLLTEADRAPARRAVAFCRTIKTSRATTKLFESFAADPRFNAPLRVEARHVDGTMSALARNNALAWLKADGDPAACHLLANVRCLSEGVDVPSLDAVLFLSKRNSQIDVVQSVGRVMRVAPGKRYGYIIIPVVIPNGANPETELANSDTFGVVWTVLNALRAHDDRFEATINQLRFNASQPSALATLPTITFSNGLDDPGVGSLPLGEPTAIQETFDLRFPEKMEQYRTLLYGRLVEKCGDRAYFERWAKDVAEIAKRHENRLKELCATDPRARDTFNRYYALLQTAVYATLTEDDARVMLAQQRITAPIFDALFGDNTFTAHNPVSQALDHATDLLAALDSADDRKTLDRFYESVRLRVKGIDTADGKLEVIRTLYDTFFAAAFKTTAEKLGIVFTPIEVVDFILRSADGALQTYFGKRLSDKGVHILDPFTGTGTFIARLLQKDLGLIRDDDLYRKYTTELHANEIVLLSYYIAAVNIENVFHDRSDRKEKYAPFPGIVLGDTFRMRQVKPNDLLDDGAFHENSERLLTQNNAPISVIVGNPPYSIGAKSDTANRTTANEAHPWLNERIAQTYAGDNATSSSLRSLYDAYIKAFRWASDVIENERGGLLCFVTNGGWLDSNAGAGFRKCIVQEFDEIYCYNLRGNCNTSGDVRKREGGGIFGEGSRTPITILLLVRLPEGQHHGNATIHYRDIGDYLSRDDKLHILDLNHSFFNPTWEETSTILTPNEHGDWINQRNDAFVALTPLAPEKKFIDSAPSFFTTYSLGLTTNRDDWCYCFSNAQLITQMTRCTETYLEQLAQQQRHDDESCIHWTRALRNQFDRQKLPPPSMKCAEFVRPVLYRPFQKEHGYMHRFWNEDIRLLPSLFPTGKRGENVVIAMNGIGMDKAFGCLITDITPDLQLMPNGQCFPLYWYEEVDGDLYIGPKLVRHDGVSDWIAKEARKAYGTQVEKEAIFYYVYGYLHKQDYRETFAADLKKSLPRIPLVERYEDFRTISEIGRALAQLHLNYETLESYPLEEVGDFADMRVTKMRFGGKGGKDRTRLVVNGTLTLAGIPPEAFDYVVNGRSPLEWAVDRYQVRTDKASGIVNDPNLWAPENPRYIPDLCKRLVTLSLESLRLIARLP